jgi:flagellar hook-basal body complex protein FliE
MHIHSATHPSDSTPSLRNSPAAKHANKVLELLQRAAAHDNVDKSKGNPFSNLLVDGLMQVNDLQNSAEGQMEQLLRRQTCPFG